MDTETELRRSDRITKGVNNKVSDYVSQASITTKKKTPALSDMKTIPVTISANVCKTVSMTAVCATTVTDTVVSAVVSNTCATGTKVTYVNSGTIITTVSAPHTMTHSAASSLVSNNTSMNTVESHKTDKVSTCISRPSTSSRNSNTSTTHNVNNVPSETTSSHTPNHNDKILQMLSKLDNNFTNMDKKIGAIDLKLDVVNTDMSNFRQQLCVMNDRIDSKADAKDITVLSERVMVLEKQLTDLRSSNLESKTTVRETVTAELREQSDIKSRKRNVMISDLPEQGDRQKDITLISELFNTICSDKVFDIQNVIRIGKTSEHRPRQLKVTLKNENDKRQLLRNATKLRGLGDQHKFKKIYVNPDRTRAQDKESKNLLLILKENIRLQPNTRWVIHKKKVISVDERDQLRSN